MKFIWTILACLSTVTSYGTTPPIRLANPRLALVARSQEGKLEFYYPLNCQWVKAGEITPMAGSAEAVGDLSAFIALDQTLNATFTMKSGKKLELLFSLKSDSPLVEVRPGNGVEKIRVRMKSPFGIQPDLRANDLVFDAQKVKGDSVYPPSENLLLNLIDHGNAMVTLLWSSPRQQVRMAVENRMFTAVEVECANANPVWIGVPAGPGIWHVQNIDTLSDMEEKPLAWKIPFPARWCADFLRTTGQTDSFGNGIVTAGQFEGIEIGVTNPANRTTWSPSRASFIYPFYVEGSRVGLWIPKFPDYEDIIYQPHAPVLIYPFERTAKTPAGVCLPLDLARLAFENTAAAEWDKTIHIKSNLRVTCSSTCAITDRVEKMFDAEEEVKKRDQIITYLRAMDMFVLGVRERVEEYLVWSHTLQNYCDEQVKVYPELKAVAAEMKGLVVQIDQGYARLKKGIKVPADEQALSAQIIPLIDSKDPDKVEKVRALGRQIRSIGGAQDWLCGQSRRILSMMRQRAGILMAATPPGPARTFLQEIRDRIFEFTPMIFYHEADLESSRR